MKYLFYLVLVLSLMWLCFCGSEEEKVSIDYGLVDTGQEFNPKAWYGKTRRDMAKILPQITQITKDISGGPFVLKNQMGLSEIKFTFEHSERDARLINLHVDFKAPVTSSLAAKRFGVNLTNIKPQKTRRYWLFPIKKPMIHHFIIKLKTGDADSTQFRNASIAYDVE